LAPVWGPEPDLDVTSIFQKVREVASIDLRSLALFRIFLGLMVLVDVLRRSFDLSAFYTDAGVLPRAALIESGLNNVNQWSLLLANGQAWFVGLVFILTALSALAMMLGYRTRVATILCWVLLISIQVRNPIVLSGADIVYRLLLFWAMFLPLGARWSVDQLHRAPAMPAGDEKAICSVGSLALLLQVLFIYFFAALLKDHPYWHTEGLAMFYAFSHQFFNTPVSRWLLQYPDTLRGLSFAVYYIELLVPWIAFIPFWNGPLRTFTAFFFIFFHIVGIGLTLHVEQFLWICSVAWIPFLPTWFWDSFLPRLEKWPVTGPVIRLGTTIGETGAQFGGWVDRGIRMVDDYRHRTIAERALPGVEQLLKVACEFVLILLLVYVLLWNVRTVEFGYNKRIRGKENKLTFWQGVFPTRYNPIGQILCIDQHWNMFAPYPDKTSGYFIIKGETFLGDTVYPFRRVVSDQEAGPPDRALAFPNQRWRKYMDNITMKKNEDVRLYLGQYISREFNRGKPIDQLMKSFEIQYVETHAVLPPRKPATHTFTLWRHECFTRQREKRIERSLEGVLKERQRGGLLPE